MIRSLYRRLSSSNTRSSSLFAIRRPALITILALTVLAVGIFVVQAADQFFAGDGSALNTAKWGTSAAGPFTSAFTNGNVANFATVNGTGTGGSITVAGVSATENFTLTAISGTISNQSNGVVPINVSSGKTLDFSTQSFTTSATAGYNFTGPGVLALAGNTYGGGFTINSGTLVARGVNAMGGNATPGGLTINGGTITANANRDFSNKYSGITVGGNFKLGELISNVGISSSNANLTFNAGMSLGAATRTITIGANGTYTLGGVISGNPGVGLTIANASGALGKITLTGVNTYTGDTTINGGTLALSGSGSIATSPAIEIAGGAIFDVTGLTTALTLASGQALKASGTATTGTITTNAAKGLTLASNSPLQFSAFNGTTAPLTIFGAGSVTLSSGNVVTVTVSNGGTPLAAGTYTLINKGASGSVVGTAPTSLTVNGDGIAGGTTASLQITGSELVLNVTATVTPTITVTGGPLNFGDIVVGAASAEQTYTVAGSDLTADITVTAPSTDFQVSKNSGTGFGSSVTFTQSGGTVAAQAVYVRFTPQSVGGKSGDIANASTGATTKNVAVSGTGVACPSLFTVDDTLDTADANPGDGVCADIDSLCTLRAAIMESNALAATACSPLTIDFSVTGTIALTNGQLRVIHPNLTISGPGASQLTVSGGNTSRIFEIDSTVTASISGLTITDGNGVGATDSGSGGGIYSKGKLTLTGCVVTGNTTTGVTIHEGGGIFNAGSQLLTVTDCTISNNTANFGGAGVASFGNLVMTGSTVANNTNTYTSDSGRGGGIETYATTTITNSTISGNHIDNGTGDNAGGIWNCCGPLTIVNSTITGNSAAGNSGAPSAGGLLQDSCCGGSVTVLNSIIAGNTGTSGAVADAGGTFISSGYNLIGDGTGATGFTGTGDQVGTTATPINALLSLLGNFGGLTQTYALLPGSPAINAGTAGGAPASDQRGKSRFGATDIGAFESQGFTLAATGGDGQSTAISTSFTSPLTLTVTANNTADNEPADGGRVSFTAPGSGASCTFATNPATISGGAASSGTVTANAMAGGPYNVTADATGAAAAVNFALTNIAPAPDLTITKTANGTFQQGGSAGYTLTITNSGVGPTTLPYMVTDTIPTGLTAGVVTSPEAGWDCTSSTSSFVSCTRNTALAVGESTTLNVPVTIGGNAPASITNTANVAGGGEVVTSNNAGAVTVNVLTPVTVDVPAGITYTLNSQTLTGMQTVLLEQGTYTLSTTSPQSLGAGTRAVFSNWSDAGAISHSITVGSSPLTITGNFTTQYQLTTAASPVNGGTVTPATGTFFDSGTVVNVSATPNSGFVFGSWSGPVASASSAATTVTMDAVKSITANFPLSCPTAFTVNDLGDTSDNNPGDRVCNDGNGICTLRAAIEESNALPDCAPLTINFSVTGTISLLSELPWVEHPNLTIQGPGANLLSVTRGVAAPFTIFIVTGEAVTINDLTVSNGEASGSFDIGGGIYNGGGLLTINRCYFTGNAAGKGGGVMNEGGDVFINDSTISNNSAGSEGGGVYNLGNEGSAAMTLTNCTISGNTVTAAGGAATAGGLATYAEMGGTAVINLVNCTIVGNTATSVTNAGGIFSGVEDNDSTANINLKNTILSGNGSTQALAGTDATITSQGNNLASDNAGGFLTGSGDLTNTNPLLAALGNYGGTTQTQALLPGSPAINAGTAGDAPATDQRGSSRVGAVDIGAFESQGFSLAIGSGSPQSTVVNTAFGAALKVNVMANNAVEPVDGGQVTFTPPGAGASATVAGTPVTIAGGMAITGTVTANSITGGYNVAASATGATGVNFALTNSCQTITVNNPGANAATVGTFFTATFTQTGGIGTTTFSTSSTLPNGVTLSSAGVLSGTPTQSGSFPITVTATDSNLCTGASVGYTLTVSCPTITVNPASLPGGVVGTAYSQTITPSGGSSANYTYSFTGTLPPGLALSPGPSATGSLSGNPTTGGTYSFTITTTDANGCAGNRAYSVTINQAPAIISANTTTFTINIAGSFAITTSGFPTVTTITQSGALPTGVIFTDNGNGTATLSGTPQPGTNGTYPLTLTASNGIAPNAVQNFTLVVSGLVCPSTLTVNDLGDTPDASPGDGLCATSGGVCTLRAAVEEANAIPACTPLTINFSVTGTINLATVLPALDHPNLTITGPGATSLDVHRNSPTPFRIFAISASRTVTITGLKITNGLAAGTNNGGGVFNSGTLTLSQCVISGNAIETTSVGGSGFGGGIYSSGPLTIDQCEISGNSGRSGAGITHNGLGSGFPLIITNSTISGNTGVQSGGFDLRNTSASLTNCTISGNSAPGRIGGIDQVAQSGNTSSVLLTNCTVTNNTGSAAIETFGFAGVTSLTTTLKNTLVAGNVGANFTTTMGTVTSLGNNLDSDDTSGFTNGVNGDIVGTSGSPINARLGPLTNNGGPTNTHLLLPGSPAIDKGGAGVSTDQRGQARPYDFPAIPPASNGGNNSDIGAVEIQCAAITLAGLPGGTAGVAYTQSNIASGGTAPYSLSLTAGSLPSGVTISGNGLTGTPTQPGTFSFTLNATDAYGCTGSQSYTVTIVCPAIILSPIALPNATVNVAYPQTITASPAGSYTFSVTSGLLPAGLTLNSNGSFSGAPTQSGVFNFRVMATTFGSCSSFADYTLLVNCAAITVNPSSLPGGTLGTPYNQAVSASPAGTYFYSVTSGALPTGLTLNGATGAITGTPTNPGLFTFTVSAAAGGCRGSRTYTVEITCQGVSITPASLPAATAGSFYTQTINVTPAGSYTFSLAQGNLPSGLTLHPTTGVISGLPAVVGTVSFIVKVSVPNSCSTTQAYTLTTNCPPAVTLSPASLPNGAMGTAYSQTLSASPAGGNYMFTVASGSLPAGLTLNSATGVLSGTPTANGSFTFTVTATGFGSCAGSRQFTVVIGSGGCPTITLPVSLPSGSTGQFYNSSVAASPSGSYSYTFTGNLPPGVTLYSSLGVLLGYPTANGTYNFMVTAIGANNCSASQSYSVVIGAGSLQVVNDFSGDRRSDFVLWRAAQRQWLIVDGATNAAQIVQWGQAGDKPVTGDYDGDGKADLAGFGKDGHWRIKLSADGETLDKVWGLGSDVPVPGDYDGDGKTDLAVWRGTESGWYIQRSSDGQTESMQWGTSLAPYFDVPVPGDYDGDGKTDIAVFRQANGHWYIRRSSDGRTVDKAWGLGSDIAVPGDYDGDGKTDIAVWRGADTNWYILRSSDNQVESISWGTSSLDDVPAPGDYDGDGKADAAVWREMDGNWYVRLSSDGSTRTQSQGRTGDRPLATPARP